MLILAEHDPKHLRSITEILKHEKGALLSLLETFNKIEVRVVNSVIKLYHPTYYENLCMIMWYQHFFFNYCRSAGTSVSLTSFTEKYHTKSKAKKLPLNSTPLYHEIGGRNSTNTN